MLKDCQCFNVDIQDSVTVDHSLQSTLLLCKPSGVTITNFTTNSAVFKQIAPGIGVNHYQKHPNTKSHTV